jgi:hypothetical protein
MSEVVMSTDITIDKVAVDNELARWYQGDCKPRPVHIKFSILTNEIWATYAAEMAGQLEIDHSAAWCGE